MTDSIVRMYATEQQARDAVGKLREAGFAGDRVFLVTPLQPGATEGGAALADAIMAGHALRDHAEVYAEGIYRGHSLVIVKTYFGCSREAIEMLDSCGPLDLSARLPREPAPTWDEAAPMSSALGMRPLLSGKPAPLSDFLGIPTLSEKRLGVFATAFRALTRSSFSLSELLGLKLLSRPGAGEWKSSFGLPLLSRKAAPFSSMFGLKTLSSGGRGPWKTSFGLPLLSDNPAPLSSLFGMPVLSRRR